VAEEQHYGRVGGGLVLEKREMAVRSRSADPTWRRGLVNVGWYGAEC
jgi:hypothetical protein